jgi:hypothetical protein
MHMNHPSDGPVPEVEPKKVREEGLGASVQVLWLGAGLYLFSVKAAQPTVLDAGERLQLPALHVGLGPGVPSSEVEFMSGPSTHGAWLFAATDLLIVKVNGGGATLILTSVRAREGASLSIKVERLNARAGAAATADTAATASIAALPCPPGEPLSNAADADLPLPVHIGAHIRSRGDMSFTSVPWAGRVAPGLWIESFSVRPLERFEAKDLEYKGLTGSGFETPWLSDEKRCGTQGMAVPLIGFALRFKPTAASAAYECEYSGYFQSGMTVGPLRNGAPCRSTVANDPLEGIQVRLVKRLRASPAAPAAAVAEPDGPAATAHAATAHAATPSRGTRSTQRHFAGGS